MPPRGAELLKKIKFFEETETEDKKQTKLRQQPKPQQQTPLTSSSGIGKTISLFQQEINSNATKEEQYKRQQRQPKKQQQPKLQQTLKSQQQPKPQQQQTPKTSSSGIGKTISLFQQITSNAIKEQEQHKKQQPQRPQKSEKEKEEQRKNEFLRQQKEWNTKKEKEDEINNNYRLSSRKIEEIRLEIKRCQLAWDPEALERAKRGEAIQELEKQAIKFLEQILPQGSTFVTGSNDRINENCPAWKRFNLAIQQLGNFVDYEKSGIFVLHGTPNTNIPLIFENGFDPSKRSGQVYGRGEYFSYFPHVSQFYCRGDGKKLIVCYVLKDIGDKIHWFNDKQVFVIDNPTDWSYSYCLPLLEVTIY
ncbi:hypothetical protein QTN25_006943 [Entamoeba marina]